MNWEIGIDMYTLMCIKLMTNKNLLYKKINKIKFKINKDFFLFLFLFLFFFWLHRNTWDLSSPTRYQTGAPCSGIAES